MSFLFVFFYFFSICFLFWMDMRDCGYEATRVEMRVGWFVSDDYIEQT